MTFRFKQFEIKHSHSLLKVNTDAVLLGALLDPDYLPENILDIGTGCGVIALMAAQKFTNAIVDAIEIDGPSCEEAAVNFAGSQFTSRLHSFHSSLQNFVKDKSYDLIMSNPPYFEVPDFSKGNNNQKIREGRKKLATQFTLTFDELVFYASRLMDKKGKFWVIIPYHAKDKFIGISLLNQLHLQQEFYIRSKPGFPFHRCVLCFGLEKNDTLEQKDLTIYNLDGSRHSDYIKATEEYYL